MIPISEFSKQKNISEEEAIVLIQEGFYAGRIVDGEWFADEPELAEPELIYGFSLKKLSGPFLIGCLAGLFISLVIGLIAYPWENPSFEGAAGYHTIMMITLTPTLTISCGITYWLLKKLTKKFRG